MWKIRIEVFVSVCTLWNQLKASLLENSIKSSNCSLLLIIWINFKVQHLT